MMKNKKLEEQHYNVLNGDNAVEISQQCSSITLEHIKGFGNYISENYEVMDGVGYFADFGLDEENNGRPRRFYTTEQLIDLYFESLNK